MKRRTGFRPPPTAADAPPIEPLDRVLPTGPISLPESTAALLDSMITGSIPTIVETAVQRSARQPRRPQETEPAPPVTPQQNRSDRRGGCAVRGLGAVAARHRPASRTVGRRRRDRADRRRSRSRDRRAARAGRRPAREGRAGVASGCARAARRLAPIELPEEPATRAADGTAARRRPRGAHAGDASPEPSRHGSAPEAPAGPFPDLLTGPVAEAPAGPVAEDFFAPPVGFSRPVRLPEPMVPQT